MQTHVFRWIATIFFSAGVIFFVGHAGAQSESTAGKKKADAVKKTDTADKKSDTTGKKSDTAAKTEGKKASSGEKNSADTKKTSDTKTPAKASAKDTKDAKEKKPVAKKEPKKKVDPFESPNFVKTPTQLKAEFAAIRKMPITFTGQLAGTPAQLSPLLQNKVLQVAAENELRTLMAYRAVVGVPYDNMTLDRQQTAHAMAAAFLLNKIDRLDHNPPCPPGFPQDMYQFGHKGASCSNLFGGKGITGSVRGYMNDSDPGNIKSLGHRRWCINPGMLTTGFGEFGKYAAMWSFDGSQDLSQFDYDFLAFPARGLTPANMLDHDWAWNVSLNPKKYTLAVAPEAIKVRVTPGLINPKTAQFKKGPQPMPVDSVRLCQSGFGIPQCVIFRPRTPQLRDGAAYCVEIDGFRNPDGEEATIEYWVVFTQPI